MATAYPGALDTSGSQQRTDIASTDDLDASGKEHDVMHVNHAGALIALETKLGLTDSNAVDGAILVGSAASTTSWTTTPAIDITGNAATVTVADTTDTTCSVALFESATGSLAAKTDSGVTYNAGTGMLSATGLTGPLTGTLQTAAQATITSVGTLTSLAVTGAITAGSVVAPLAINPQTGTTYTLVLADAGKLVTSSNGSAQTITVPPTLDPDFDVGTQIIIQTIGSANATLAQGTGVTINSKDSNKEIDGQWAAATLIKTATNVWTLIGALA